MEWVAVHTKTDRESHAVNPISEIIAWSDAPYRNSRAVKSNHDWFHCLDCGVSTHRIREYYMVQNSIWDRVVKSRPRIANLIVLDEDGKIDKSIAPVPVKIQNEGMLCIGCLETRVGRKLRAKDFTDCHINVDPRYQRSVRLQKRMMTK